jgi:D-alanyl-lipoteichoic acid acyltransferase DltB (MBOAT superfamily)
MSPFAHIVVLLGTLPLVHLLGRRGGFYVLTSVGALAVLMTAPGAFWAVLLTLVEALLLERVLRGRPRRSLLRQYLPYVMLLNVLVTDVGAARWAAWDWVTTGAPFAVLRIFMTTKQLLGERETTVAQRLGSLASGAFFLPLVVVGPICSGCSLWEQSDPARPESASGTTEQLYRRLFAGWILAALVAPGLSQLSDHIRPYGLELAALMGVSFCQLFASFWGCSLIAETGAALSGYAVPVNFDAPWRARDPREFWQRWHMSMSRFAMQY